MQKKILCQNRKQKLKIVYLPFGLCTRKGFLTFWQINSIFESDLYSGSKHATHCFYYDIMSLLLTFTQQRYCMHFTGCKFKLVLD